MYHCQHEPWCTRRGEYHRTRFITEVVDENGKVLDTFPDDGEEVVTCCECMAMAKEEEE